MWNSGAAVGSPSGQNSRQSTYRTAPGPWISSQASSVAIALLKALVLLRRLDYRHESVLVDLGVDSHVQVELLLAGRDAGRPLRLQKLKSESSRTQHPRAPSSVKMILRGGDCPKAKASGSL